MPTHLAAYYKSVDPGNAYAQVDAAADQILTTSSGDIQVPSLSQIVAVAAGVASGGKVHARLTSPTLRRVSRLYINPVNGGADAAAEPGSPPAVVDYRAAPRQLTPLELLRAEAHSDPTVAVAHWVLVWLADAAVQPLQRGEVVTVRGTGTTTLSAGSWTAVTINLDEELEAGRYGIVGMKAISTGCIAARVISRNAPWRPGVLGSDSETDIDSPLFRYGGLGILDEFLHTDIPQLEFLSVSADTAETVYLDLVKLG